MQLEFAILLVSIVLGFAVIFYLISKKLNSTDPTLLEWIRTTQASLQQNSTNITHILSENTKQLNDRLEKASQAMRDVNLEVGKMTEIGRSMKELQEFLKSPKLRGTIGEQILKDLITQTFPKNNFFLQYEFRSGEKVDAIIKTDAGLLPIDAKFPMENFQKMNKSSSDAEKESYRKEFVKDIRKHIDAIAKKYILPDEGTMDFALMYIPSEAVFYELVNMDEIMEYARGQRVYAVSPSTLYAHLQTILLSFEGRKIEKQSQEVFRLLRALQIDYKKIDESIDTLGKHLTNASNQYVNVSKGFSQFGQKLSTTGQIEGDNSSPFIEPSIR